MVYLPEIPKLPVTKRKDDELDEIARKIKPILNKRAELLGTDEEIPVDREPTRQALASGLDGEFPKRGKTPLDLPQPVELDEEVESVIDKERLAKIVKEELRGKFRGR